MDPKKFWIYKRFESNLTKASEDDDTPCMKQFTPTVSGTFPPPITTTTSSSSLGYSAGK